MSALVNQYLNLLDLEVSAISEIDHEDSLSSVIYKIDLKDQSSLILKICWDDLRFKKEVHHLQILQGVVPVPKIVSVVEPKEETRGAILMEYIDAEPLNIGGLTEEIAFSMGKLLAHLHEVPVIESDDPTAENRKSFARSLSECREIVPADLLGRAESYYEKNDFLLDNIDGPCIVHRDYRPANVLASHGEILSIIDWEIARVGFAEEDFTSMDMLVWRKDPSSREAFLKGYSSVRSLPHLNELLPFLRVFMTLGAIGFTSVRKTWQTTHKRIYEENLQLLRSYV